MMKNFLVPVLIFIATTSFAQNQLVGMKGGISWSNIHSKEISTDAFRTGFTLGLTYENRIKQHLLVGGELLYQQRGYREYLQWVDDLGDLVDDSGKDKFNCNYLSLPLKVGYVNGNKLSWFANVGFVPSILIEAKHVFPEIFVDTNIDVTQYVQKFDLAGLAEVGGNLQISEKLIISVSFSYQHSLSTFDSPEYFDGVDARHYGMILSCGVKYVLR
jgi:hypothetical protein